MTPWTAAHWASLSVTNSWSLLKLMSIQLVMPSNHLILCHHLLLPPSIFPSIRVFSNESVHHIRGLVNVNYRVFIYCTCHFQSGSLFFILPSSVCKSLQCLISTLTQGTKVATHLGSLVHLCCGEGGTLQINTTGMSEECSQCMDHTGFAIT